MSEPDLQFRSFADVVRWVIEELGAMCPSPERLAGYWENPGAVEYRDIRYHVEEAGCPICRAERHAVDAGHRQ
ncbi:MAG: hypothetical protein KatS3mg110_1067 [Pirellulaceae bacterium]|nr:MAG: hypothetical protein KatS3mg110_1067 [Pirellulaceae bacterium]